MNWEAATSEPPTAEASRTALGVASLRAAHQLLDGQPRILDDPVAVRLIGPEGVARITAHPGRLREPRLAALRCHVVLRSRYAEDRLAGAVRAGVRQCVIVGAGFDTFAYRQPGWARALRIFEVDQPASQAAKRDLLARVAIPIPDNLTYVELDLERLPLRETLAAAGLDFGRPVFFSCLGVLVYLTREAVRDFFRLVGACPAGSELVLTYSGSESADDDPTSLAARAKELGEPWLTRFSAQELTAELSDAGLRTVEFLSSEQAARYLGRRDDGLEPPRRGRILSARV